MEDSNLKKISRYANKPAYKKLLGEGTFGIVELHQCKPVCTNNTCNDCYIVKHMITTSKNYFKLFNREKQERIVKFYKEYEIGILLDHKNIRRTLDINMDSNYIIFEDCKGIDLLDYANEYKIQNTRHLVSYFYQILDAVNYLHNIGIAHLDLKLENIVVNPDTNVVKLIDFGEACFFKDQKNNKHLFSDLRGTVQYLPPECVDFMGFHGDKTDVWCCCIILYNLFYNVHPWEVAKLTNTKYKIHYSNIRRGRLNEDIFPKKSEYTETEWEVVKYLFKTMLNPDPDKRISINKAKDVFGLLEIFDNLNDNQNTKIHGDREKGLSKTHTI